VIAAGAALGTVYALSRGTSSTPPGTGLTGVTGR
jgi:xanthosine utilization system XapX-like protein